MKKRKAKPLFYILVFFVVILLGSSCTWLYLSSPVDSKDTSDIEVVIPSGSTSSQIGSILKEKRLIKSELLFKVYLKMNHVGSLKASTYIFHKSMNLNEIIETLEKGNSYNPDEVRITFREGERITTYAEVIAKETNHTYDEVIAVFQDVDYVKGLIGKYWFLTESILSPGIYYPLEGYLAPETYYFMNKDVEITEIIEKLLDQNEKRLEKYKATMEKDPHYYLTMASIADLEGNNTDNRMLIVGVFENRLKANMNLGSDVTSYYGVQASMKNDITAEQLQDVNPYNTRLASMAGKMPIGPICNPSDSSLQASVAPTASEYYFFVADKNGKIYFTKTEAEHNRKIQEIKNNGDWIW